MKQHIFNQCQLLAMAYPLFPFAIRPSHDRDLQHLVAGHVEIDHSSDYCFEKIVYGFLKHYFLGCFEYMMKMHHLQIRHRR